MANAWDRGALFVAGILLGGAAAVWFATGDDSPLASGKREAAPPGAGSPVQAAVAAVLRTDCSYLPMVRAAGSEDGKLGLPKSLEGKTAQDASASILLGKEAGAAGRPRDAEIAFLTACRVALQEQGNASLIAADAKYQLGRHYVALARDGSGTDNASDLRKQAELLLADSLQLYRAKHGDQHEKTKFAAESLGAIQQQASGAGAETLAAAPAAPAGGAGGAKAATAATPASAPMTADTGATEPKPDPAAKAAAEAAKAEARKAEKAAQTAVAAATPPTAPSMSPSPESRVIAVTPKPPESTARTRPSFDCGKARSTTEKLICGDDELASLDRELGKLHARAKRNASDRGEFQRESDRQWQAREQSCTDRDCLLRWYAQRRQDLEQQARAPATKPAAERKASAQPTTSAQDDARRIEGRAASASTTPPATPAPEPVVRKEADPPKAPEPVAARKAPEPVAVAPKPAEPVIPRKEPEPAVVRKEAEPAREVRAERTEEPPAPRTSAMNAPPQPMLETTPPSETVTPAEGDATSLRR